MWLPTAVYHLHRPGGLGPSARPGVTGCPARSSATATGSGFCRAATGPASSTWARLAADDELGAYGQERLRASYAVDERATDPDLWYFESFAGRSATDTPLAVFEELRRRRPELRAGVGDPRPRPLDPAGRRGRS